MSVKSKIKRTCFPPLQGHLMQSLAKEKVYNLYFLSYETLVAIFIIHQLTLKLQHLNLIVL